MSNTAFVGKVSKGSKFNQIYIPNDFKETIEAGDTVEVKLLKKKQNLFLSNNDFFLSDFKKKLIKDIFSELNRYKNIHTAFVIGSFLSEIVDFNDIDIILISDKTDESKIYHELTVKFNQKFHIISYKEDQLKQLLKICPLTISMFTNFISDKKVDLRQKTYINKKHLKFLLMMPEDLLKIEMQSKVYFDNLRRLIVIERFLENKSLDIQSISNNLKKEIQIELYNKIKQNERINDDELKLIRKIIKNKIIKLKKQL